MKSIKKLFLSAAVFAAVLGLVGCKQPESGPSVVKEYSFSDSGATVTIKFFDDGTAEKEFKYAGQSAKATGTYTGNPAKDGEKVTVNWKKLSYGGTTIDYPGSPSETFKISGGKISYDVSIPGTGGTDTSGGATGGDGNAEGSGSSGGSGTNGGDTPTKPAPKVVATFEKNNGIYKYELKFFDDNTVSLKYMTYYLYSGTYTGDPKIDGNVKVTWEKQTVSMGTTASTEFNHNETFIISDNGQKGYSEDSSGILYGAETNPFTRKN